MIFSEPAPFEDAIKNATMRTMLPTAASSAKLMEIPAELRERAMFSARTTNAQYLERVNGLITRIVSPETVVDPVSGERRPAMPGEYMDKATARLEMKKSLQALGYQPDPRERGTIKDLSSDGRLNLIIDTNTQMIRNHGYWMQGQDTEVLDEWPAQELIRVEAREEERDWLSRWQAAGGGIYGGRMIAVKNSPVWIELSIFGLPYPPFDWNSGMGVMDVPRDEAVELGVIDANTTVAPDERAVNQDVETSAVGRESPLFGALLESLGPAAEVVDGVLRMK